MNKSIWLLVGLLIAIVLISGCAGQNKESSTQSQSSLETNISNVTVPEQPKNLTLSQIIIQPNEVANDGYILDSRGERSKSEIDQASLDKGWKEGYFANFKQEKGTSSIEIVMSKYPESSMSILIAEIKADCKGTDIGTDIYGSYSVEYELMSSPFTDSVICKATATYPDSSVIRYFHLQFVKKDVYTYIKGPDQEIIENLANIMRNRIW